MMLARAILGSILVCLGLVVFCISLIGVYRFRYVLNRMHASALCDTLGSLLVMLGLAILFWSVWVTLKLACILGFLWLTGPVATHRTTKVEVLTDEYVMEECEVE